MPVTCVCFFKEIWNVACDLCLFVKSTLNDLADGNIHHLINHLIRESITLKCLKINFHEAQHDSHSKSKEMNKRILRYYSSRCQTWHFKTCFCFIHLAHNWLVILLWIKSGLLQNIHVSIIWNQDFKKNCS